MEMTMTSSKLVINNDIKCYFFFFLFMVLYHDALKNKGELVYRFAQRNLLRIYPKATRVTSSNYNPLLGWTHGAQMVALNMQV